MLTRLELIERFAVNLERERDRLGLSQKQFADKLEISLSTYKRIIAGTVDKIDLFIAYKLYLVTGKLLFELLDMSDERLDLQKKLRGLSLTQLNYVHALVDFEKKFAAKHENVDDYVTVYVPTGNMYDGMIYDTSSVEKLNVADYRKRYGDRISCGIRITSNHLHPTYNLGDVLLICQEPVRDGDTGVFINVENGCAYIRKFHQTAPCRLEPVNGLGETFFVDSDNKKEMDKWIKFGYVLAKVR